MPGVADQIRKTQVKQAQQVRKQDMKQLIQLVDEGRLHEADEHQLETLKLALELNSIIGSKNEVVQVNAQAIADAVSKAIGKVIKNLPERIVGGGIDMLPLLDPSRPGMKHTSLSDLRQLDEDIEVVDHDGVLAGESKTGSDDAADKLAKLKKLRNGQG